MFEEGEKAVSENLEEKTSFDGKKVKVLGETYVAGKPEEAANWRKKLTGREEMLAYLKVGVR